MAFQEEVIKAVVEAAMNGDDFSWHQAYNLTGDAREADEVCKYANNQYGLDIQYQGQVYSDWQA